MNYRLTTRDEQEDEAFRARLAPLSTEVLPRPILIVRQPPPTIVIQPPREPPARTFSGALIAVVAACIVFLGIVGVWSIWNGGSVGPIDRRPAPVAEAPTPAAPTPAAPAPTLAVAAPSPATAAMIDLLMQRGNAALAEGDIAAARLLFERAAGMGSAVAATAAGNTYDADFLSRAGARGIRADPAAAAAWYRKAAAPGDADARARLAPAGGRP